MKKEEKSKKLSKLRLLFGYKKSEILYFCSKFYRRMTSVKLLNVGRWKALLNNKVNPIRNWISGEAGKEVTLFQKSNYPFSFKPFLLAQGLVVLLMFTILVSFFIPNYKVNPTLVIKTATTKQTSAIVANGQPVKWTIIVKRSDIKNNQYLVSLPKSAKNIKVKTLSAKDAEIVLTKTTPQASVQLTIGERQKLALSSQPSSFFAAGLLPKFSKFFLSSAKNAIDQIIEQTTQEVTITDEAKLVDLSNQALAEQPTKKEEKEQKKEKKQEEKQEEKEIKKEAKEEIPVQEEQPAEILISPETDLQTYDVGNLETVSPSDQEVIAEEEVIEDEFVEIKYETPAPTITEQETDEGKLVTVSSGAEQTNCESLNPEKKDSILSYIFENNLTAGLVNAVSNILATINRFFTADLEQAVSQVVEIITGPTEQEISTVDESATLQLVPTEILSPSLETSDTPLAPSVEPTPSEVPSEETPAEIVPESSALTFDVEEAPTLTETPIPDALTGPVSSGQEADYVAYQKCLDQQIQLTDVVAFTVIPEIFKVGDENKIKIKWQNNGDQEMEFHAFDLNNNGKLDYVEWTVPHLSDQYFEIIFISKAFKLNENREIIEDIYTQVQAQDNNWATVSDGQYVRVTFEQILDNTKDNTIYAKPTNPSSPVTIEVYPVYTDADGNMTEGPLVAIFENIDQEKTYKVLLTNLQTPTDVFDLKIIGNIDIDYIVDPTVTYYWYGGTGSWSDYTNHWSTNSGNSPSAPAANAPTSADNVIFDTNSGTGQITISTISVSSFNSTQTGLNFISSGGNINITSAGAFSTTSATIDTTVSDGNGGSVTINAAGTVTIGGAITTDGSGDFYCNAGGYYGGAISITATNGGSVSITAGITSTGGSDEGCGTASGNGGAITINAGGSVTTAVINSSAGGSGSPIGNGGAITISSIPNATVTINGNINNTGGSLANITIGTVDAIADVHIAADLYFYPAATTIINGNLTINTTFTLTTTGSMTVTGNVNGTGAITQVSLITVGGDWINTGTFTASSAGVTLTGTGKQITGSASGITFSTLTVNGTYTNNNTTGLTVSTALSGTGTLTNSATGILNLTLPTTNLTITTLDATVTGNTVNYNRSGPPPQTVRAITYYNLTISAISAKTLGGNTTVAGALNISSGTLAQGAYTLNVAGDFVIASGAFFTKATGGQALTLDGTGNLTDSNSSKQDLGAVVIGGTTTTRTLTTATKTTSLTINSGNTFVLAGNDFSFSAASAVSNSGIFRLQGGETLTNVNNLGTAAGTVEYVGRNTAESLTVKDFGVSTDYYNLTINDTNTNKATFALGANLAVANNLTVSSGTLAISTYDLAVTGSSTVTGGTATIGISTTNGWTTAGMTIGANGTVTCTDASKITDSGNWTNSGVFTAGTGTVTFNGTSQIISGSTTFYNLTKSVLSADTLTFTQGTTQTISNVLTLNGASGQLLSLRSSSTPNQWNINPQGTRTLSYLDVMDSNNTNGTGITTTGLNITDSGNNTNWTFNTVPSITAGPSDNSSATTPTNVGSSTAFTATATDTGPDNYYLAICKTDSITANNNAAPTCATSQTWCVSSATNSGTEATCSYTTLTGDSESNAWYAFVCDNNSSSLCSSSSQGTGDNGSPFKVNHIPVFAAISTSPDLAGLGSLISFLSTASDADTDTTADTVTLYVCKSNDFTGTACGAAGEWCHSSALTSNPTCSYTVLSSDTSGTKNYYGYIVDNHNFQSSSNPRTSTFDTDIDTPVISAISPSQGMISELPSSVSFAIDEVGYCRSSSSDLSYSSMTSASDCSGGGTTSITCSISSSSPHTLTSYISCQDVLGNENSASNNTNVSYNLPGGASGGGSTWYTSTIETTQEVVKTVVEEIKNVPQAIVDQVNNIGKQITDITNALKPETKEQQIVYPPIEESVAEETPLVFKNSQALLSPTSIRNFVLAPLSKEIQSLIAKFPELKSTLKKLGIIKMTDLQEMRTAFFNLPNLNELLPQLSQGTALPEISEVEKSKIPTGIVFASMAEEKIGLNVKVSITDQGEPIQTINTIQNQIVTLSVKPEYEAKTVKGYVIFKGKNAPVAFAAGLSALLNTAEVKGSNQKTEFVLDIFDYADPDKDGIYTANIVVPAVNANYEVRTMITYKDSNISSKEFSMIMLVDPEGYVYRKINDSEESRIKGVKVSLYWLNPETKQYEIWPAKNFQQSNPQITDATGKYSFLVPEGYYYIKVEHMLYANWQSDSFEVQQGLGIHTNIELKSKNWLFSIFNPGSLIIVIALLLLTAAVLVSAVLISSSIQRKRLIKKDEKF